MMAKIEQKNEAIKLRKRGHSLKEIAALLNVSKSSVSGWVSEIELNEVCKERIKGIQKEAATRSAKTKKEKIRKNKEYQYLLGSKKAQEGDTLHLKGCMLYWGEGSKKGNTLAFCNANIEMLKIYCDFLRTSLGVKDSEICWSVHLNQSVHTEEQVIRYWQDGLNLEKCKRNKILLKKNENSSPKSIGKCPYGTCYIKVHNTKILYNVLGAIDFYKKISH